MSFVITTQRTFHNRFNYLGTIFILPFPHFTDALPNQFKELRDEEVDIIFLVGGFSTSPLLRQRIQREFKSRVKKIVMPPRPGVAILKGAASFGVDPTIIRARRSRLTCLLYTSPSPRDGLLSRMPSSA